MLTAHVYSTRLQRMLTAVTLILDVKLDSQVHTKAAGIRVGNGRNDKPRANFSSLLGYGQNARAACLVVRVHVRMHVRVHVCVHVCICTLA